MGLTKTTASLHEALRNGARLHAFRSGGGLRVVRLEKEGTLVGYGEHPNIEEALDFTRRSMVLQS